MNITEINRMNYWYDYELFWTNFELDSSKGEQFNNILI